jgi:deoxycytidylate deaminase
VNRDKKGQVVLNAARRLAKRGGNRYYHHAAIVYRGGRVISSGFNHHEIHAEANALFNIWPNKRKGCRLLSIRVSRTGSLLMAKPCTKCLRMLRRDGIKSVDYSTAEGTIERMKL